MNRLFAGVFFCFLLLNLQTRAQTRLQQITDPLATKMEWYSAKNRASLLFVHFDKNIYTSSEQVWFTAYFLYVKNPISEHHTLAVALIRNDDSVLIADQKFVITNGLSFGNLTLPDTLAPGNYSFFVYSNVLSEGKPVVSFVQPITIKAVKEPTFTASLKLAEKITADQDSAKLSFKAFAKDIKTLASYTEVAYSIGEQKQKLKTDLYGDASFKVGLKGLNPSNHILKLDARFKEERKTLQIALPVNKRPTVKFFPEGGSLTAGIHTVVGWEVYDVYGQPMQISGILFRNNSPVDTIQTNGYGMGRFVLAADANTKYYVKLVQSEQNPTEYILPETSSETMSVTLSNAVCNDTLRFHFEGFNMGMYYGMMHNYTEHFFSFPVDLGKLNAVNFRVPLSDIPKGITTLTIIDSMGRPVAERLFFAHYDQRTEVVIETDKQEYNIRQNVKITLQLKNKYDAPVNGFASVACVQDNRFDLYKNTDIESYTFLNSQLSSLPFKKDPLGKAEDNLSYWEDILLIKGWRRYTWHDLLRTNTLDTVQTFASVLFKGELQLISTRNIKKPVDMSMITNDGVVPIRTDSAGKFVLRNDEMIISPGKQLFLFVNGKAKDDYIINLKDPYHQLTDKLRTGIVYDNFDAAATEKSSETMVIKKGEKAEMLQEVIVTTKKEQPVSSYTGAKNECGDYVCPYNILNCPNHTFGGTIPVKGKSYGRGFGGGTIIYAGCNTAPNVFVKGVKGIYTAKEFYTIDYKKLDPNEGVYQSTVFWNYSVPLTADKPLELSFFLGDIPGKFRVVVQGITTNGVIHQERVFNVLKKE